jgi:hypothetical protein
MTFKEFVQITELQGLYGVPKAVGGSIVGQNFMRSQMKHPFGKGRTYKRLIRGSGPNVAKPAHPSALINPIKPTTASSFLK